MIFDLTHTDEFPDPRYGNDSGFYAVGGEITPERLAKAYPLGIFPYYAYKLERLCWWAPKKRFVIYPSEIHISHSMRNLMNKKKLHCTINQDFAGVLSGCACIDGRFDEDNAWLGPELIDTWMQLHDMGYAKSVEVWEGDELVGGLYGFVTERCFLGDSMFSVVPSASKLALIHLARHMEAQGGGFIDCQLETPHLKSMGARYIPYEEFIRETLPSRSEHLQPLVW
jgi:leucyl/phenylalanyl-tRNA--protein transferase